MNEPLVDILMSVHNGEKFLVEQLESLVSQTHKNWRLVVRDDNSTDSSVRVLNEYLNCYPEKIVFVSDRRGQLGACQGFAQVVQHSSADYMMFCDQDDVWLPTKVESSLAEILKLERLNPGMPIAVYTDLIVVDEELKVLAESFWRYQQIDPQNNSLGSLMLANVATGCTMILNRPLKELAVPVPSEAIIHDWWFSLVCSVYGKLSFLSDRTVLYRQHGKNEVGAQDYRLSIRVRRLWKSPRSFYARATKMAGLARVQSRALLSHIESKAEPALTLLTPLRRYVASTSVVERKWCLLRYKMLSGHYLPAFKKLFFY
jgi:glycosyltransferase involved in cell wall biosynthesis